MTRHTIAGAYAAAPEGDETEWYELLRAERDITGLELAFTDTLHHAGPAHLAALMDPGWSSVVTCIPQTARALTVDPLYGLASDDASGRRRAIDDLALVHEQVGVMKSILGERSILAVEVHSAPNTVQARSSVDSLTASLSELASWSWNQTAIMVEHCDAAVLGRRPHKGFLALEDEIAAVALAARSSTVIGHTINWARSAIEGRDPGMAREHVDRVHASGAVAALMFSGVSPDVTRYGEAWSDAHLPISAGLRGAEASSLLTASELHASLRHASHVLYTGVKVGSGGSLTPRERLEPTLATLHAVHTALRGGAASDQARCHSGRLS